MKTRAPHVIVIGAGIGGLATAMRLAAKGISVRVLERHDHVGGKMRVTPSAAGDVDAGPTVMTMASVFKDLFAACQTRLEDHVPLSEATVLARHWWADGTHLDLGNDQDQNIAAISRVFGTRDAQAFRDFSAAARRLFEAFDGPMMAAANPKQAELVGQVIRNPGLAFDMQPLRSLAASLSRRFKNPQLAQLFGRYATYLGGSPYQSPALLALVWHAEASGVWSVKGGMHQLAQAMRDVVLQLGGTVTCGTGVAQIEADGAKVTRVITDDGTPLPCDAVVFNGDPRALKQGLLGNVGRDTIKPDQTEPRSLSAYVWSFAARPTGRNLSHHNVFFADDPQVEFGDLSKGQMPRDATLYVCAQDRAGGQTPEGIERFEIIMNGPPTDATAPTDEEVLLCKARTFERLTQMGLSFDPIPPESALTTPATFNRMFPASMGSLYGRAPTGLTSALKRPRAKTAVQGLYLAGGGAHPGAGIPMAALSGKHAAEAILSDLTSALRSNRMATRGGMSTGSVTMAPAPSRSSVS